uniref:Uncharacterized protein n=1 Tax=Cannabis sativa TaxID=3483 RepID=A0A803NGC9_CANSA
MYDTMEETIRQQGDHIRKLREQQAQPAHVHIPLTPLVVPQDVGNPLELLYEKFRKHNRPVFEGDPYPLKAEQWMSMITSIFDFVQDEGMIMWAMPYSCYRRIPYLVGDCIPKPGLEYNDLGYILNFVL